MRYIDEYRDSGRVRFYAQLLREVTKKNWTLMEICGGQTHTIVKYGIDTLLPPSITLVHGPGCPVCITPVEYIDKALEIASDPWVIFCSFGDMMRVPGTHRDLLSVKAHGGDVRMVYSPMDALAIAERNPDREVVFFAVGFETTAPANAMAAFEAKRRGIKNFSLLVSQAIVPPAMEVILEAPDNRIQGFLAAGHVCTITGFADYEPIVARFKVPIVITGFEPLDILQGVFLCVCQLEEGRAQVENQYSRCVRRAGNIPAQNILSKVFKVTARVWRGIGEISESGLSLSEAYADLDAERRFGPVRPPGTEHGTCINGLILRGLKKPMECPSFGGRCTPESPLGASMVSSEGACAAYFRYRSEHTGARVLEKEGEV